MTQFKLWEEDLSEFVHICAQMFALTQTCPCVIRNPENDSPVTAVRHHEHAAAAGGDAPPGPGLGSALGLCQVERTRPECTEPMLWAPRWWNYGRLAYLQKYEEEKFNYKLGNKEKNKKEKKSILVGWSGSAADPGLEFGLGSSLVLCWFWILRLRLLGVMWQAVSDWPLVMEECCSSVRVH